MIVSSNISEGQTPFVSKFLGLVPYSDGLALQERSRALVREASSRFVLLGLEHPSVVTLGKRGILTEDVLPNCPFPVVAVDRGGQATLHGPGQLVIYPICRLAQFSSGVQDFVARLESTTAKVFLSYGVSVCRAGDAGLYTSRGKIAFVGLRVSEGITSHGISINLSNSLADFSYIRSCGQAARPLDRLADWVGGSVACEDFFQRWVAEWLASH